MSPDSRSVIAAIAWTVVHGRACAWVYDHDRAAHRAISASLTGAKVGAYDHERRVITDGEIGKTVIDHSSNTHISVERTARGLKGFDHASQHFYEAVVEGERVSLYDYADGAHHEYAVR